jgi:hypothetical protein
VNKAMISMKIAVVLLNKKVERVTKELVLLRRIQKH